VFPKMTAMLKVLCYSQQFRGEYHRQVFNARRMGTNTRKLPPTKAVSTQPAGLKPSAAPRNAHNPVIR